MSRTLHVDAEPTEDTPLIAASHDGNETSAAPAPAPAAGVSLGRGLAITVLMGLLILIQGMCCFSSSHEAEDMANCAIWNWTSDQHLHDDHHSISHRGRSECLCRNGLVQRRVPCMLMPQSTYLPSQAPCTHTDRPQIGMSCMTPLAGRLSAIFTPRVYVLWSCALLSAGLFVTAAARSLAGFLAGRAIAGAGSGGLLSTSLILVLDLASTKRRGLCIGMTNAGYTTGVASGAVFAGLLTTAYGWVRIAVKSCKVIGSADSWINPCPSVSSSGFRRLLRWFWAHCCISPSHTSWRVTSPTSSKIIRPFANWRGSITREQRRW